jgi:hypothetical protein
MPRAVAQYDTPEMYDTRNTRDSNLYNEVLFEHWTCDSEEYSSETGGNIIFCHEHRLAVRRLPR